jgi:hypothetical protein
MRVDVGQEASQEGKEFGVGKEALPVKIYKPSLVEKLRSKVAGFLFDCSYAVDEDTCVQACFDIAADSGFCDDCSPDERWYCR